MAKLIKARKTSISVKQAYIEPITCPHCGGHAFLMRRTLHPKIKGEVWTFECKDCGKQTEKSKLQYTE
jgi:transcription elongation factor Elf1